MLTIAAFVIITIILLVIYSKQLQELSAHHASIRIIRYLVAAIVSAFGVLSLIFAIGEVSAGDMSGLSHILVFIPMVVIAYLLLRR